MKPIASRKPITDIHVREIGHDTKISDFSVNYPDELKQMILEYMKKQSVFSYTTAPAIDAYTGKIVADYDNGITDGEFYWHRLTEYYFEKYNLKLNDDFIEYVKKAS